MNNEIEKKIERITCPFCFQTVEGSVRYCEDNKSCGGHGIINTTKHCCLGIEKHTKNKIKEVYYEET